MSARPADAHPPDTCSNYVGGKPCQRPARMAVRTTRPSRDDVRIAVFADDRVAPMSAMRYCKACGLAVLAELATIVVDSDEEAPVQPTA